MMNTTPNEAVQAKAEAKRQRKNARRLELQAKCVHGLWCSRRALEIASMPLPWEAKRLELAKR